MVDNYYKINMLEKKLLEEVKRYNEINKYGKTMIMEQDAVEPPPPPPADAAAPAGDMPPPPGGDVPPPPAGDDMTGLDALPPPPAGGDDLGGAPDADTKELDVTELVDMVKNLKKDLDGNQQSNGEVTTKMDDVFSKLGELEQKLASMDNIVAKIDELGSKVEQMKPETPQEKLEMRSLDSYPFNQKPVDFFANKQAEMRQTGKNEYVLTKDDVDNFSPDEVKTSFNPIGQEDEYSY
jgi:hypothetical protein